MSQVSLIALCIAGDASISLRLSELRRELSMAQFSKYVSIIHCLVLLRLL